MENNNNIPNRLDTVNYRRNTGYIKNGLTITSNNPVIHPRDEAGNIILQENSESNPLLIIEPVSTKLTMASMLKVLDTTFQYFKFPVSVTPVSSDINLEFSLNTDPVYARYKPSEIRPILISNTVYSGILIDEIVDGLPQRNSNTYFITKEIKNSGVDLRFRIKLQHYYDGTGGNVGTSYFSIISSGPDRPTNREFRGPFANYTQGNPAEASILNQAVIVRNSIAGYISEALNIINNLPSSPLKTSRQEWFSQLSAYLPSNIPVNSTGFRFNTQLISAWQNDKTSIIGLNDLYEIVSNRVNTYNILVAQSNSYESELGSISTGETQNLYIDLIIRNFEFEIGDSFGIGAKAGQTGHSINSEQTYWVITDASKNVDIWNQPIVNTSILTNIPTEQIPIARTNAG
jgi:hypothetical protein